MPPRKPVKVRQIESPRILAAHRALITYQCALDVPGAFIYISPQVEGLLGYPAESWTEQRGAWLTRMHPEDLKRILPKLGRAHRNRLPFTIRYRLKDSGGRFKWILDESEVIRGQHGETLYIQGTWTEVSETVRLEQETAGKARELAASRSELEQFVSVASHQLRAPIRRIINLSELLAKRRLDPEAARLLAQISESAAMGRNLVDGMVTFAEAGRAPTFMPVDMEESLRSALRRLDDAKPVTAGPLPKVWGDPALIERVLHCLLDNALKFRARRNPAVHVSAERSGPQWVVSIRDNGIGIAHKHLPRVFSIFDRLHPGKQYPGIGLGLAVCRKLVERLGGQLSVESEPGEGSTFRFTLHPIPGETP